MYLIIEDLLDKTDLARVMSLVAEGEWMDGRVTAGPAASTVKLNEQLVRDTASYIEASRGINDTITRNLLFQVFAYPEMVHSILFSRMGDGGKYGEHCDNAFMGRHRTDLAFTLFLSDPQDYEGGALRTAEFGEIKLNGGDAVLYPASLLHEVTEVKSGTRVVCCGWVQSRIKSHLHRLMLFELNALKMSLFSKYGKSEEFDIANKLYNNLQREWS
jgi:PKHD-type hydroxylase